MPHQATYWENEGKIVEDQTYVKPVESWYTFYEIKMEQSGNPKTWNARAGPSESENYVLCK